MTSVEAAYIAGLFDGEGCVTCKKKPTKRADRNGKVYNQWYIRCEITMTDKEVISWIHEVLGFGWSRRKEIFKKTQTLQETMAMVLWLSRRFNLC